MSSEEARRIKLSGVDIGAWAIVEPQVLMMRTDSNLWMLEFDKDYTRYRVTNFKSAKHHILPGKRVTPEEK